jgi:hypothetical protein
VTASRDRRYRIAWQSKLTGAKGAGNPCMGLEDGRRVVEDLNSRFPDLIHWLERPISSEFSE